MDLCSWKLEVKTILSNANLAVARIIKFPTLAYQLRFQFVLLAKLFVELTMSA